MDFVFTETRAGNILKQRKKNQEKIKQTFSINFLLCGESNLFSVPFFWFAVTPGFSNCHEELIMIH